MPVPPVTERRHDEGEPADLAEWTREVNAAMIAGADAAAEAEAAATGTGSRLTRTTECMNARERLTDALARVEALTVGYGRPSFVTRRVGEEMYAELSEQVEAARERGRAACESIERPR